MIPRHLSPLRWKFVGALAVLFCARPGLAADPAPLQYDLYSWQKNAQWRFSLFEGTGTIRGIDVIQAKSAAQKNLTMLKGRLAQLQPKDTVYWKEGPSPLRIPPPEIVLEMRRYMDGLQVTLILPDEISPPKKK